MSSSARRAVVGVAVIGIAAIAAASGCDARPTEDPCAAPLAALRQRLEDAAARAEPPGAPDWVDPPAGDGVPMEAPAALLVITRDDIELAGRGVGGGDADEAAEVLAEDLARWGRAHLDADADRLPVGLWASPDTPVERIQRAVRASPPEARFGLLVRGAPAARDGDPDYVTEAFRDDTQGRPRVRRQRIERAWRRATSRCEPARNHLVTGGGLEAASGPALGRPSVARLLEALAECGCEGTGLAAIEAVQARALLPRGPLLRARPWLRFGPPTDAAPEVRLTPDADVAALVEALPDSPPEGTDTVWVRVD